MDATGDDDSEFLVVEIPYKFSKYHDRNRILKQMGYATYASYQRSALWQSIRSRVLEVKICNICRSLASCVHHTEYTPENLSGKSLIGLIPLCMGCHKKIEFNGNAKRDLDDVDYALKELRSENGSSRLKRAKRKSKYNRKCPLASIYHARRQKVLPKPITIPRGTPIETRLIEGAWHKWAQARCPEQIEFDRAVQKTNEHFVFAREDAFIRVRLEHLSHNG